MYCALVTFELQGNRTCMYIVEIHIEKEIYYGYFVKVHVQVNYKELTEVKEYPITRIRYRKFVYCIGPVKNELIYAGVSNGISKTVQNQDFGYMGTEHTSVVGSIVVVSSLN